MKLCLGNKLSPGVDFKKVGRTARIIERALSICSLRLRPTIMPVTSFSKVGRYALPHGPNFMKLTSGCLKHALKYSHDRIPVKSGFQVVKVCQIGKYLVLGPVLGH